MTRILRGGCAPRTLRPCSSGGSLRGGSASRRQGSSGLTRTSLTRPGETLPSPSRWKGTPRLPSRWHAGAWRTWRISRPKERSPAWLCQRRSPLLPSTTRRCVRSASPMRLSRFSMPRGRLPGVERGPRAHRGSRGDRERSPRLHLGAPGLPEVCVVGIPAGDRAGDLLPRRHCNSPPHLGHRGLGE